MALNPVTIESLDQEGRGIAHEAGKVVFIDGALPGELVTYTSFRSKARYEQAQLREVLKPAAARVAPRCRWFGVCGGCTLQHLEPAVQVAVKQRVLEDALWHLGRLRPEQLLPAVQGAAWGYRHRARLTARYVARKGGALVGFHEKRSSFVADMTSCEVLPPRISALIAPLRELINGLSVRERLPQVEVAVGERVAVLVLRVLESPGADDEARLRAFAEAHGVQLFLQPGGPDSAQPFHPAVAPELDYSLPEFGVVMPFRPTEFTQVNPGVNRILVRRALQLLAPRPGERIADFFCGLGNFALPIAARGAGVVGFEGSAGLVQRACDNAGRNGLAAATAFVAADLSRATPEWLAAQGRFDAWLLDPPRDGAVELCKAIGADPPRRIVYVSCNPATLARDAGVLVQLKGYRLKAAGVVNMFPHTAHVESVALFERE